MYIMKLLITFINMMGLLSCLDPSQVRYSVPAPTARVQASGEVMNDMVLIRGGCFQMGDTFGDGYSDEKPVHEVCLDDFYIGKFEVTNVEKTVLQRKLAGMMQISTLKN
jgi:formylglycine-generating enzyme required for sulfatase activity